MPNRLANETSPYLLQHANNPVEWYPWGPEALERAKQEDKPILLSIGYSACHWCHVMEHESFENEDIARIMPTEVAEGELTRNLLDSAAARLKSNFDTVNGGFGNAPKFPSPMNLEFLLRSHLRMGDPEALAQVEKTLHKMARGGIYDQLG